MLRSALFRSSMREAWRSLRKCRLNGWVHDAVVGTVRTRVGVVCLVAFIGLFLLTLLTLERDPSSAAYAQVGSAAASPVLSDRMQYVGDAACLPCHEQESRSYSHTSHHLTSRNATKESVLGSFASGSNVLTISTPETIGDPRLYFSMEAAPDGLYQTAIAEQNSDKLSHRERIDVVIGSGARGQTYLYWSGDQLYELPVSYWTDGHQWINSPGYRDGTANFGRRVSPRCLECHATYIKALSSDSQMNLYDRGSLVTGISCETCHGAGAAHIAQERSRSDTVRKQAILNPAKFDRDRQIDQCALCHNGTQREELMGAFSYVPGQPLNRYLAPNLPDTSEHPDVHGNQVGLLERSRCYLSSPSMTCSTCHNVHATERVAADYSDRCLSCHRWQSCGEAKKLGIKITHNCIDCHMPLEQTNAIVSDTAGRVVRTTMRTHWIKIYPETEITVRHTK
jgi:cytochrome c554/c'-like protein